MTSCSNRLISLFCLVLASTAFSSATLDGRRRVNEDDGHFEPPIEDNVINPAVCLLDASGFGGSTSSNSFTVEYYQEMEFLPTGPDSITDIIKDIDSATVDVMLAANQIFCTGNRRTAPGTGRYLVAKRAVGMSTNPDDEVLELSCQQIETTSESECAVVASGFTVFYVGEGSADDGFEESFKESVKNSIETDSSLVESNTQIVQIKYADPDDYADQQNDLDTNAAESSSAAPIIIGALAGTMLIGAAAVVWTRNQNESQSTNTSANNEVAEDLKESDK